MSLLTSINTNAQRVVKCADGSLVTAISLCPAPDAVQSGGYNTNPDSKPSSRFGSPIYDSSKIDSGTIGISNSTSPAVNGTVVPRVNQSMNMVDPRTEISNGTLSTNSGKRRNTQPIFTDRNKKLKPANTQVSGYTKFKGVSSYTLAKKTGNTIIFAESSLGGSGTVLSTTLIVPVSGSINESTTKYGNKKIKDYNDNSYSTTEKQELIKLAKNLRSVYLRQFRMTNSSSNTNRQLPSSTTRSLAGNRTTNTQSIKPIVNKPVNNTPAPCVSITTPNDGFRYPTATDGTGCPIGTKLP